MKKDPRVLGFEGPRVRTAKRKTKSDTEITEGGRRYTEQRGRGKKKGPRVRGFEGSREETAGRTGLSGLWG